MLTFRSGAAGGQHAGAMADYLIAQIIPVSTQALANYYQRGLESDPALATTETLGIRPEPRRDMSPALAALLKIDMDRPLTRDEIAHLLSGYRADSLPIDGKQYQKEVLALADVFGLDPLRAPTPAEMALVLSGRRVDGGAIVDDPDPIGLEKAPAVQPIAKQPDIIAVAEALSAAGIPFQQSAGRLRIKASWRGGENWSVSVNARTGQWRDHASNERGNFPSLRAKLNLGQPRVLAEGEARAVQDGEAKAENFRRSMAIRLWNEAIPGAGGLAEPMYRGSAGQRMRQRSHHEARVEEAARAREIGRRYLASRSLDAEWLLPQVRLASLHPKYDASERAAGAVTIMLTPMFGKGDGGRVELCGVQRTYLTADGEKVGRRMLGPAGALMIQPPEGPARKIGGHLRVLLAGEGFETVASVVQATGQPGVVAYNAAGLTDWADKYRGSDPIVVLADRDVAKIHQGRQVGYAGQIAGAEAVDAIKSRGGRALYLEPPAAVIGGAKGADWADALAEHGEDGLRAAVKAATAASAEDLEQARARTPKSGGNYAENYAPPATIHHDIARLHKALGAKDPLRPTATEREHMTAGRMADGSEIDSARFREALTRSRTPIGYVDFTWSADKSVSVAWAFAKTEAERNLIAAAHRNAVASAMRVVERHVGQARKGAGGQDGTEQGSIAWISFDHYAARPTLELVKRNPDGTTETEIVSMKTAGDPQLHTHITVPNVVLTEDGRVGSLNTMTMHSRIHEWGAIYQAHLAQNLRKIGVDTGLDLKTGAARIRSIPQSVCDLFSKRTRTALDDARDFAKASGYDWDALSPEDRIKVVKGKVSERRAAKDDDLNDFATWMRQAEEAGYQHKSVIDPAYQAPDLTPEQRLHLAYEMGTKLLEEQFERRAVVAESDMRVAAARGLIESGIQSPDDVDAVRRAFTERGVTQEQRNTSLIEVSIGDDDKRITTTMHLSEEREVIDLARKHAADTSGALSREAIDRAVAHSGLDVSNAHGRSQLALIYHLGEGSRFAAGIGAAGAGKSTLLRPLTTAWHEQGRDVHGISLGWRQSNDLRDAGITNIAAVSVFIDRVYDGKIDLTPNSVVVVDELGTLGTRQLLALQRIQDRTGCKLVAVGDPKQCASIEAGFVTGLLDRALGKLPSIETSVRQTNERAAWVTSMLRDGIIGPALSMKREDKTAEIVPGGRAEVVERAAVIWHDRMEVNADRPDYTLSVSAPTNEDARAISVAIRRSLQAKGKIGADLRSFRAIDPNSGVQYDLPLAVGDKVRLFARTQALSRDGTMAAIGDNGSVLEVRGIARDGLILRNDKGREGLVEWQRLADKETKRARLTYGYAMTTNTAQGLTTTEHIFVTPNGSQTTDGHKAYVSGSRHRERDFWLTSEGAERAEVANRRPLGDPRIIKSYDLWENWARNISRRPEKLNATDLIREAEEVRLNAANAFMQGMERQEATQRTDGLAARFDQARAHHAGAVVAHAMAEAATHARDAVVKLNAAVQSVRTQRPGRGAGR